jgi:hypothetical protein
MIPLHKTVENTFGASGHEAKLGKILAGDVNCTPGSVYYPACRSVVP